MMLLLDLPAELLTKVFASLDLSDIIHFETTCKACRRLVADSVEIQYIKELAASQCLSSYPDADASCRERFDALKAREIAWRTFLVSSEQTLTVNRPTFGDFAQQEEYTICGDFLVRTWTGARTTVLAGISWSRLPFRPRNRGDRDDRNLESSKFSNGCIDLRGENFRDCLVDIQRDLGIFIRSTWNGASDNSVQFWSLSKRSRHPEAVEKVLSLSGSSEILLSMQGDTVLLGVESGIKVMYWRTGRSTCISNNPINSGAAYLTDTIVLLVRGEEYAVEIFDIACKSAESPQFKSVLLELPAIRNPRVNIWMLERLYGKTNRTVKDNLSHPVKPGKGIFIIYFEFEGGPDDPHIVMDISRLIQLYRRYTDADATRTSSMGPVSAPWEDWGPQTCRAFEAESRGRSLHGSRVILKSFGPDPDVTVLPIVEILDFNPYARRNSQPIASHPEDRAGSPPHHAEGKLVETAYITEPTTIRHMYFKENIVTALPYWYVVRREATEWDDKFVFNDDCVVTNIEEGSARVLLL